MSCCIYPGINDTLLYFTLLYFTLHRYRMLLLCDSSILNRILSLILSCIEPLSHSPRVSVRAWPRVQSTWSPVIHNGLLFSHWIVKTELISWYFPPWYYHLIIYCISEFLTVQPVLGTYWSAQGEWICCSICQSNSVYTSVAEPEPVELKLFGTWSRSRN